MNIQQNESKRRRASPFILSAPAIRIFVPGFSLILASLFRLLTELQAAAPFSAGGAAYYGAMLEYPLAALTLLTGGCLLADYLAKSAKD